MRYQRRLHSNIVVRRYEYNEFTRPQRKRLLDSLQSFLDGWRGNGVELRYPSQSKLRHQRTHTTPTIFRALGGRIHQQLLLLFVLLLILLPVPWSPPQIVSAFHRAPPITTSRRHRDPHRRRSVTRTVMGMAESSLYSAPVAVDSRDHFQKRITSESMTPSGSETSVRKRSQCSKSPRNKDTKYPIGPKQQSSLDAKQQHQRQRIRKLFREAKELERQGLWRQAVETLLHILQLDPTDAYSHLALARLEARRSPDSDRASQVFRNGTLACPHSVHLWQAWAVHEEATGNVEKAQQLFETALRLEPCNHYVCHAYGLLLDRHQLNRSVADTVLYGTHAAQQLWQRALKHTSTAALVCSMGASLVAQGKYQQARELYATHVDKLPSIRERTEVLLASSWLEERYFANFEVAMELLQRCPEADTNTVAQVALARLEGRRKRYQDTLNTSSTMDLPSELIRTASIERLSAACTNLEQQEEKGKRPEGEADGRVFNAWARMEVEAKRYESAKQILQRGIDLFPKDYALLQAAGTVEEKLGNVTGSRELYRRSLTVEPSAPCLVSFALLELKHPQSGTFNFTQIKQLFEEALLLDPRHGPAYNAYARCVFERDGDEEKARGIFERGVRANCPDAASLYHGYAKLELALGNIDRARELLLEGQRECHRLEIGKDSPHRERALFLTHTLGMLELNSNRPADGLLIFCDGVERYGNSSQLLLGAALCEVKLGNVEKARHFFERAVFHDPCHAQAWQAWGVMEMKATNYDIARKLFKCGIKSAPRHGSLWHAYALMESRVGQSDVARYLFARGIQNAPKHISLYQAWAAFELNEGQVGAAKALITQALTRDKRNGQGWLIASEIERRLNNVGLSRLLLRRGIECAPAHAPLYKAFGDDLLEQGKIGEARDVYKKGIDIDPLHAPLYHALAELEARVCNLANLAELHRRAAAVFRTNALDPSPRSEQAWASKIKATRNRSLPREVAALVNRIVDDEGDDAWQTSRVDPMSFLDGTGSSLLQHGLVNTLLNLGD